jgi:hypothetical protein
MLFSSPTADRPSYERPSSLRGSSVARAPRPPTDDGRLSLPHYYLYCELRYVSSTTTRIYYYMYQNARV